MPQGPTSTGTPDASAMGEPFKPEIIYLTTAHYTSATGNHAFMAKHTKNQRTPAAGTN